MDNRLIACTTVLHQNFVSYKGQGLMIYPTGFDCIWLASDKSGNLAAFVTAGLGPIPITIANDDSQSIEDLETRLMEWPEISDAILLTKVKRPDDFVNMSRRGLFVFDWTDIHRTRKEAIEAYELVAKPSTPLHTEQLPFDKRHSMSIIELEGIEFGSTSVLQTQFLVPSYP
jgi:hypothetical protein